MSDSKNSLKSLYQRFIQIRGNPSEIAMGFSLGIFIGMSPTMGVQIFLAILTASFLQWNKFSAVIGVFITNAFTAPIIYPFTYYIGALFLNSDADFNFPKEFSLEVVMVMLKNAPTIFGAMTIGGIVTGIPLAILSYFAAFYLSKAYQNKRNR